MQFKKISLIGGETLESPSIPPLAVAGWVDQARAGLPEALAALANPGAAVDPCPAELEGIGWVPITGEEGGE